MKNVLVLLKSFNYPPRNGGDQAVFNAIAKLHEVVHFHLIGMDGTAHGQAGMLNFQRDYPDIPSSVYDLSVRDKYQKIKWCCNRISNFVNNRNGNRKIVDLQLLGSYDVQLDYYDGFYRFLNQYIQEHKIDIVQGEFHFTLGFLKGIAVSVKKVFVAHELQFVVEHQRLMQREHTDADLYFYHQQRQQEINAMNACDAIITLSATDRQKLIENGVHAPIFPSFAQITLRHANISYPIGIRKQLVFIGPELHQPNKQGLEWFLENVWPLIHQQDADVTVRVIGAWSGKTKESWTRKYKGIYFLGYVDDLPSAIAGSILIVPLFQGSGIRMKILEACNTGIPFVATSIGAEGLGFTSGKNCFITDDVRTFAEDVMRLFHDQSLTDSFVKESIHHIHEKFSDEKFVDSRMKCYNQTTLNSNYQ